MIAHIVLLKPRPGLGDAERDAILGAVRAAAAEIPSVRACRIGRRVKHGVPGYEEGMGEDFEYAAVFEFDDIEGLKTYLEHPRHAGLGRHFTESADAALAYDYELIEISAGASLPDE